MNMAFTTWSDLKTKMENDLADISWRHKKYEMDGMVMEYTSYQDFKAAYDDVCSRAALENGACCGRTYARGGGRF